MSLLDLHEDEMLGAAEAAPQVAPRRQEPKFSVWGVMKAAGGGVPAGVAESGASGIDLLSGLSKVDVSPQAMRDSQSDEGRKRIQKQAQETLETGFRSDAGRSLRNVAADYLPDPLTAHAAEVVVGDFSRVATKAVTAGVTLGPVLGAVVAGAEEGFTASDKLAEQGVDVATRSKVGAITGAVTAASFALPVAGKSIASTVGLAAAGGPVSFVAQQAATREILQNADYDKLADQYDPLDPVGLTLSTLIPLGFGAAALRSSARAARADAATVEAARVNLLAEGVETSRPEPDAVDLSGAHEAAYSRAIDQMAAGERVDVGGVAKTDLTPAIRQFADQIDDDILRALAAAPRAAAADAPVLNAEPPAPRAPADEGVTLDPEVQGALDAVGIPKEVSQPVVDAAAAVLKPAEPAAKPVDPLTRGVDDLIATRSDMLVQLEGMDTPQPIADVMARIRQEAAVDLEDSPLVQAAAECAIRNL